MKVRITMEGTTPLLMHNVRLSDPLDPIARQMKEISSKRTKTDEDLEQLAHLEFEGGLYWDPTLGPYIPGNNIEKCLVEGGRLTKSGKQIERGLFITDNEVPLLYKGPRDPEALWADLDYRSRLTVRVGMNRVVRCRPHFREWALEADGEMDTTQLNIEDLEQIASSAGMMIGLGDHRPRYGRFRTTVEAL